MAQLTTNTRNIYAILKFQYKTDSNKCISKHMNVLDIDAVLHSKDLSILIELIRYKKD